MCGVILRWPKKIREGKQANGAHDHFKKYR